MKIPKYIKTTLSKCQKYFNLAISHGNIIRDWMHNVGIVDDDFEPIIKPSNIADSYIDIIEEGSGSVNDFLLELEQELKRLKELNNVKN